MSPVQTRVASPEKAATDSWLYRLLVPRTAPGWLIIYVRTPDLRIPIIVPVPVGWVRDIVRGARHTVLGLERFFGKRIRTRLLGYLPAGADWYASGIEMEKSLPEFLRAVESILDLLQAGESYTLVEVHDEDTRVLIRMV